MTFGALRGVIGSFELLGQVRTAGMRAEVRHFSQVNPNQRIWSAPAHILTYRCSPGASLLTRPISDGRATNFAPEGPLTFRPKSAQWESISNGAARECVLVRFTDMLCPRQQFEADPCSPQDASMIEMMRLLHGEICTPGFASTAMVESVGEVLRIKLSRLGDRRDADSEGSAFGTAELDMIHEYIDAQNGRSPSVTELAALFQISRRSLLRRFKSATSMTVAAYITQVQLAKAKRLLLSPDKIIKQIAYETGFSSASHFTVAFERAVGCTPSAYRSRTS
jgi:AraC-like DNA-binding protein